MASRASACSLVALAVAVASLAGAAGAGATALVPDEVLAGVGGPTKLGPPTRSSAWIARLTAPALARSKPGRGKRLYRFGTRARWNGGPVGLLITGVARHGRWLKVMLPRRPNGIEGWIPAGRARLSETPWRIEVSRARRTLTLLNRGEVEQRWSIVIGAPSTPTPSGLFAVNERVRQPDPNAFLGTWILHLTAFSDVLDNFGGGPGRVGIHGRGGASLNDPLGSAASHGCLRMDNAAVDHVARVAREGTPVRIR